MPNSYDEQNATRFDEALKKEAVGEKCHDVELRPFVEVAAALRKDAARSVEALSSETAKNHKTYLLNMADHIASQAPHVEQAPAAPPVTPSSRFSLKWLIGASALLAVAVIGVVMVRLDQKNPPSNQVASLFVIPEAHAGDAFTLIAEKQDSAGAAVDTAFKVTTKVDVSSEILKQHLRIIPPVPVDIESIGEGEFRVTPKETLHSGEVYRLALATDVQKDDGSIQKREFSWAIQTKDVFRVLSSVPGNRTADVPLNTGIEVTMSQTGWEDPKAYFSISPQVDGHFETHGRSLAFVPSKPLEANRIYTVTYKKGWKIAGSDLVLADDHVIQFETTSRPVPGQESSISFSFNSPYVEAVPNKDIFIGAYVYTNGPRKTNEPIFFKATGYSVSKAEVKELINKIEEAPVWAARTRSNQDRYATYAKQQIFEVDVQPQGDAYSRKYFQLPAQAAGYYLIRFVPQTASTSRPGDARWVVLQVTSVATYMIADKDAMYVWAMNLETQQPLGNLPVALDGKAYSTDAQGIARLVAPALLTSTSTFSGAVIAEVGTPGLESLLLISKQGARWSYDYDMSPWGNNVGFNTTWGYLLNDRPLYRLQDSLSFFGLAQDRDTHKGEGEIKVQVRRGGFFDYGSYEQKVYAETVVTPDAAGFVRGSVAWEKLAPGYYQLVLQRNGQDVITRGFEVRDIVKPAYTIDILPKKNAVYASESLEGQIKVSLFDGTPLKGHKIRVNDSFELTTDEGGLAAYRLPITPPTCDTKTTYGYCSRVWSESISVEAVEAEEADIQSSTYVSVWRAKVATEVETKTKGDQATASFLVRRVDLSKTDKTSEEEVLTDPVPNKRIEGRLMERQWVKNVQGQRYDYFEKKIVPTYRYTLQETEIANIDLTTGADGRASMNLPLKNDTSYRLIATVDDGEGHQDVLIHIFSKGWYDQGYEREDTAGISFDSTDPEKRETNSYAVDEPVSLAFFKDKAVLPEQKAPTYLFVEAMRGIKKITASTRAQYEFRYREELVPNMTVYGVVFSPFGFVEMRYGASFHSKERGLELAIIPDKTSYAPGASVKATVEVRTPNRMPVRDAQVAVAAIDEALLAAAQTSFEEYPLHHLYGYVEEGIVLIHSSHKDLGNLDAASALADGRGGGGGGDSGGVRRNFKDTAIFQIVSTDADGRAMIEFKAPDNITSWRLNAVAMTSDLKAGSIQDKIAVTKPIFIDAVIPQTLLVADKPILKVRVFGAAAKNGEAVEIRVNAPTLGLANEQATGTVGTPLYLGIDRLTDGEHVITFQVKTAQGTDAIERKVRVLNSRLTHDELVTVELGPGVTLPDAGLDAEEVVSFMPLGRARYFREIKNLAYPWSARLESKVAAVLARRLLIDSYGQKDVEPFDEPLTPYQIDGLAPLPYASQDVELTSKIAALDPTLFDKVQIANYLWLITDDSKSTREQSVRALAGLAALNEPVLNRLQIAAQASDLSWREQLAIARGLEAAGDREGAARILEGLLKTAEERDGLIFLAISQDRRSIIEATTEAAALAQSLSHPKAKGLAGFVEKNWAEDAMTDLDRIYYLTHVVPTLHAGDVTVTYVVGDTQETVKLEKGMTREVTLTASEMKGFRVISVDGPVALVFARRAIGSPKTVPEVQLTRSYEVLEMATGTTPSYRSAPLESLTEGMTVQIALSFDLKEKSQDGCYVVRDRLPSGLAPLQSVFYPTYYDGRVMVHHPVSINNNEVSFVACKSSLDRAIIYRARVVSRGTYIAEPASIQSMEAPSVTALTDQKTIVVK